MSNNDDIRLECDKMEASWLAIALLREVMAWHSDTESPDYNECDKDPCCWCVVVESAIAKLKPKIGSSPASDTKLIQTAVKMVP